MTDGEGTGFETGLDQTADDSLSPDERSGLIRWYLDSHGTGSLDLVKFAPFLIDHDPGSLKRYRRHVETIAEQADGVGLPQAVVALLFLHAYSVLGNERGILYQVVAARRWGATRREVVDTIGFAFLEGGPRGMNAAAELSDSYLRDWTDGGSPAGIKWPDNWSPDPGAFRSGIDYATDDLLPGELEAIESWQHRMCGSETAGFRLLAQLHGRAYKTHRIRYERAISSALPAQMFPLYTLHLATIQLRPRAIRSSLHLARRLGVARHHAVQTIWWGLLYGGETLREEIGEAAGDMLREWEAPTG